jgi:hypothetical protein
MRRGWIAGGALALAGCVLVRGGPADTGDPGRPAAPADARRVVADSGERVSRAASFRYALDDLSVSEYSRWCESTMHVDGAIDTERRLAFLGVRSNDGPTVVLAPDTLYVKASVLPRWRIPTPWLSVAATDAENVYDVSATLGLSLNPRVWSQPDRSDPTTGLAAMKDSVTAVQERGHESVRAVDTTRYDLTIDPAKSGLWTGGTTSTRPGPAAADKVRDARRTFIEGYQHREGGSPPAIPPDVVEAFVNGDNEAFLRFADQAPGTTMPPDSRAFLERLLEGLGTDNPLAAAFAPPITATAWVDGSGVLRRLEQQLATKSSSGSPPGTAPDDPPRSHVRLEYWAVGEPVADVLPAPADVTPVSALSRTDDVPEQLSPCAWRRAATR